MTIELKYSRALDELVAHIKTDRSILAALLCGSLSHDTVWEKSDIDLAVITLDDKKIESSDIALNASGVNVHLFLMPRADFRKMVEGTARNSFMHSLLAKGRLLYTHDETIRDLCERLTSIGARDTEIQLLAAGAQAIMAIDKAHKWFVTRADLDYTGLWILYASTPLARIEVLRARQLAGREVIPQALALNPEFFKIVYTQMLNTKKTHKNVGDALEAIAAYLRERAPELFRLILEYLKDSGETRSASELENHFKRNFNVSGVTTACEYLADQGLITKVSVPVQLTRRSNVTVEELAFVHMGPMDETY